jgi:hypothetical protein
MARKIVARLIVAVLLGIATGYAVGKSLASDAAKGRDLTLKEYVADFENHKKELVTSNTPMAMSIAVGVSMVVVFFGVYELLVLGVDKMLDAVDRRRNVATQRGTPPPW